MELRKPGVEKSHQTDIGVLPVSWEVRTLGSISTLLNGRAYGLAEWEQSGTPVIRLQNLTGGEDYYYSNLRLAAEKYCFRGDLLYMWSATFGPHIWQGGRAIYHYHIWKVVPKPNCSDRTFLYHKLSEITALKKATSTNGGTMLHLTKREMESTLVAVPPLPEQEAIAEALSDADTLIESLSFLLAKKRKIKQGAMQELLTGKTRLPGFQAPWARTQLGKLLSVRHGRNQRLVQYDDGPYPILATGGQIGWANRFLHDKPSVLIGRKGTIDEPQFMDTPFWTVDTLFYTDIHPPNVAKFLFYRLCLVHWMRHNEASGVPSLSAKVIESIEIEHPDADEQQAIADVLSTMDAEIESAEARLQKARRLKQGMMQALLTGRIRLAQPAFDAVPLLTDLAVHSPSIHSDPN
ncbi:restriction modification system DNA specificity domain [Stenotrophomonas maltophilia]|nr:restriction modification system DNA specificity domain [Stenotrophomonas maltophilia]